MWQTEHTDKRTPQSFLPTTAHHSFRFQPQEVTVIQQLNPPSCAINTIYNKYVQNNIELLHIL